MPQDERRSAYDGSYEQRITAEIEHYREVENVHDLPKIYDYWSTGHVDPLLRAVGIPTFLDLWIEPISSAATQGAVVKIVSLGSGNGDFELTLAKELLNRGIANFVMERLELNPHMRERAVEIAASEGLSHYFVDLPADLNTWTPAQQGMYEIVMANHSLHHVLELEHLFQAVREALGSGGFFIINDMIGRNGHMRWPEALLLVEAIWSTMPNRHKRNHQFSRIDEEFVNWDCSTDGFEGIRAQDILPLLNATFSPELFVAFANVIDPFVDRGFGHNFDPDSQADRDFIDAVARLDEAALSLGLVKPTHLLARYKTESTECRYPEPMSPKFSERRVTAAPNRAEDISFVSPSDQNSPSSATQPTSAMRRRLRRFAIEAATIAPPIRRLRTQRDRLAVEVARLTSELEKQS